VKSVKKEDVGENYCAHFVESGGFECLLRMTRDTPHPNVVKYLDFLEGPDFYYVVMEQLSGAELFDKLAKEPCLTENYIQDVMRQVFASLAHLHDTVGVFHRDLKLENLRYRGDGALVLVDFGFMRFVGQPWDRNTCGTILYMAPEVIESYLHRGISESGGYSPAVDLWAAGVLLYVLLSARFPFSDKEAWKLGSASEGSSLLARALSNTKLSSVSSECRHLLEQLLVLDPARRISASQAKDHPWFSRVDLPPLKAPQADYALARGKSRRSMQLGAPLHSAQSCSIDIGPCTD